MAEPAWCCAGAPMAIRSSSCSFSPSPAPQTEPPTVSRLLFAPAINQADQPVTVMDAFPSGIRELYFFFDYRGFRNGTTWQPVLVRSGQVLSDTWPSSPWSGGPQGMWWVGLSDAVFPDGTYEIRVYYDGKALGSATAKVGGPASAQPTFGNLTLATGNTGGAEGRLPLLPAGGSELRATFDYAHMTADTPWSYRLYREGKEEERGDGKPPLAGSGKGTLLLRRSPAFSAGNYRLELYVARRLSATVDFTLVDGPRTLLGPITFAEGVDRQGNPVRPGTAFKSGLKELYAFFDYDGMQDGWGWSWNWYLDGKLLTEAADVAVRRARPERLGSDTQQGCSRRRQVRPVPVHRRRVCPIWRLHRRPGGAKPYARAGAAKG
jgi:hypothetical protein